MYSRTSLTKWCTQVLAVVAPEDASVALHISATAKSAVAEFVSKDAAEAALAKGQLASLPWTDPDDGGLHQLWIKRDASLEVRNMGSAMTVVWQVVHPMLLKLHTDAASPQRWGLKTNRPAGKFLLTAGERIITLFDITLQGLTPRIAVSRDARGLPAWLPVDELDNILKKVQMHDKFDVL